MVHQRFLQQLILAGLILYGSTFNVCAQNWNPNHSIGTINGVYNYAYNQTPAQLVEIYPAGFPNTGLTYQWYSSFSPVSGFTAIPGAIASSYNPSIIVPGSLSTYYYRQTTSSILGTINSNTIKIAVVSVNWEDVNYIRVHDVLNTGYTTWTAVDQLSIGQKLQTTTYLDGLGRNLEKVSAGTAAPASGTVWGDMVQFSQYDAYGREPKKYLPYTTTNQPGKYKTAPLTDQPQYFSNVYNETSAFELITFEKNPLGRAANIKESGAAWAASAGKSVSYDINDATDNVHMFSLDYVRGDAPRDLGLYPASTLYKKTYADENGKRVVEFIDKSGQLILKKVQLDDVPTAAQVGWICTYSIYDDFGLLRFRVQPEGVKFLDANGWSFAAVNGATVFNEYCFQYDYDDKGRNIWKKAPGAAPLNMVYDSRDRLVFTQDGNQAALSTPQWTATLYDGLDRPVVSTLYNTIETAANLNTDIGNAPLVTTVTINAGPIVTTTLQQNPIPAASLNNTSICTVLKFQFYDNYQFTGVKAFDNNFNNLNAYSTTDPNVQPIVSSPRTINMPTGSLTRVLGSNTFLASTSYYDNRGLAIQNLTDNIKSGVDIITRQYRFDERVLSTCHSHSNPGAGYNSFITLTKYDFDKIGRVTAIEKQFGTNAFKTIASYDYDDIGRVKTKHLDPGYTNPNTGTSDLESLNYSFNIHNQITGINKDYALKNPVNYNKWGHFFGVYLGYDNRDNVFVKAQLNGQVTGQLWNTQGDDAQRKYDYSYDNARRLINASFTQQAHPNDGYNNATMDFSVSGTSGQITYDLNGNLLTLLQKGVIPGTASPITIDDLRYSYSNSSLPFGNKLQSVADMMTIPSQNGLSGDFVHGNPTAGIPDYVFDNNGNVVVDLNKNVKELANVAGANGIHYNFLDKPDQIRIAGKGTITIVYSANGQKLQRVYAPENGAATTTTTYINGYVYQSSGAGADKLSFINFEEGRIRAMTPTSLNNGYDVLSENGNLALPNAQSGAYDYFLMDYQQNVRVILTEETHSAGNTCTMETSRASVEDPIFGQPGAANEVETTRWPTPAGWQSINTSASVSRLGNLAGHAVGPNTLQKVMAGDQVTASVQYYFQSATGGSNTNFVATLLNSLGQAIGANAGAGPLVHNNANNITSQLNGSLPFKNAVQPAGAGGTTPQAYLTVLFFDERFNFIGSSDGGVWQQQVASTWTSTTAPLGLSNIKAPKNGYAYVYVSNQSDQDVYFDNLQVTITAGNIIEEDHYYAFGLKIAALSSRKLADAGEGAIKNNYLYNDKELFDDGDLGWYDYGFRNYDPQIGRFPQLDPLADGYPYYSPYQFAGNDPIANVDLDGLEPQNVISFMNSIGAGANATAALATVGKHAGSWTVSWVKDGVAYARIFKAAKSALKPVLGATAKVTVQSLQVAESVAQPRTGYQQATTERLARLTAIIHDVQDPDHPIIMGTKSGGRSVLLGNSRRGYIWGWGKQGIEEDEGFWLIWMPLPKGLALLKGAERGAEVAGEIGTEVAANAGSNAIVKSGVDISEHAARRMAQRGITSKMVERGISKGLKFFDPKNNSINYVLKNGFASGKDLLIGTNPLTGGVTTVIRGRNLINSRFIPMQ